MRRARSLGPTVIVGVGLVVGGCLVNWWVPIGFTAEIEAGEKKPLTDEEIAKLRDLTKKIAKAQGLHSLEVSPDLYHEYEIYDVYGLSPGPGGRGVGLFVSEDRRRAGITVTDRNYAENDVGSDVRNVMDRLHKRIAEELPERAVKIEKVTRSFWEP